MDAYSMGKDVLKSYQPVPHILEIVLDTLEVMESAKQLMEANVVPECVLKLQPLCSQIKNVKNIKKGALIEDKVVIFFLCLLVLPIKVIPLLVLDIKEQMEFVKLIPEPLIVDQEFVRMLHQHIMILKTVRNINLDV